MKELNALGYVFPIMEGCIRLEVALGMAMFIFGEVSFGQVNKLRLKCDQSGLSQALNGKPGLERGSGVFGCGISGKKPIL